jgi:hypothetical protein
VNRPYHHMTKKAYAHAGVDVDLGDGLMRPVQSLGLLLWREGGDDFFEARVAAERVPERHQF